jgi:hypothetical protein
MIQAAKGVINLKGNEKSFLLIVMVDKLYFLIGIYLFNDFIAYAIIEKSFLNRTFASVIFHY